MRCVPVLLVMLCTQGAGYRPPAGVQELEATLGGQVTVISGSSPLWNKEHISSWCRQATREICDDVVDSNGATSRGYKGRAALVSHPKKGPPRVTISGLRDWDTGLYCWRTWNGTSYTLVKRLLLQVLHGFHPESHPRVLRLAEGGPATLECLYAQAKRWSKVWCKQTDEDTCDWIGHSDGVTNLEYVSRALVTNDPQAGRMALVLKELQIWDTGAYRCMESGGSVVLCTVVLVVSPAGSSVEDVSKVHKTPRRESPTPPSRPAPGPTPPGAERGAHSRPVALMTADSPRGSRTGQTPGAFAHPVDHSEHSPASPVPSSDPGTRDPVWGVLRWLLLLLLVSCTAAVSCCDKMSYSRTEAEA